MRSKKPISMFMKLKQANYLKSFFFLPWFLLSLQTHSQEIHRIACNGDLVQLDSLLSEQPLAIKDGRGRTLMHWAVACRQKEIFDFLVKRGLPIHAEDNEGDTPLYVAIQFNIEDFFQTLLEMEKKTAFQGEKGIHLLERAILEENTPFVRQLVEKGINVNYPNARGSTPLEIAMRIKNHEIAALLRSLGADTTKVRHITMAGEYMDQNKPGLTPRIFAPNFISTEESEFGSVFNKDITEFFYAVDVNGKNEIRYSQSFGDSWSAPKTILEHEKYGYNDPFLSPDEKRLYFISKRALDGKGDLKDQDIWYIERLDTGWSEPINVGPNINSSRNEYYMSFTREGTMYFSSNQSAPEDRMKSDYDVYKSSFVDGVFQEAIALDEAVNTPAYEADVFVDPAETYLIFCGIREDGLGQGDLYISFRNTDGTWGKSKNMGAPVNTKYHELCPFVTNDGRYLFYTSNQDIYWVDTQVITNLREGKEKK